MTLHFYILWAWAIFNLLIGIYEFYSYKNRDKIKLDNSSIWNRKIKNNNDDSDIFIKSWNEYCKVDSKYIINPYVWIFELLNMILATLFIIILINQKNQIYIYVIKLILILQIINCSLYFFTLLLEFMYNDVFVKNIKTYAKAWMFPVYYGISSIWIVLPLYLYSNL
jgi:hypothetical protein